MAAINVNKFQVGYPIGIFILMRAALSLWAFVVFEFLVPPISAEWAKSALMYQTINQGWQQYLLEPWNRFDTQVYIKIGVEGYAPTDGSLSFFPLYPILIRIVGTLLSGQWVLAALIISNLATLGILILLHRQVADDYDIQVANRTCLWLIVFPMAFFLFAGYTESLFIFFALLSMRGSLQRHWWQAGIFAGLATLTRIPGILLIVPVFLQWFINYRQRQAHLLDGAAMLVPVFCGVSFLLYLILTFGDLSPWFSSIRSFHTLGFPGQSILASIQLLFMENAFGVPHLLIDVAFALIVVGLMIWGFFHLKPLWSIYSLAVMLPPLVSVHTLVAALPAAALPRYGLAAFPIFITLGRVDMPRIVKWLGVAIALALQAFFVELFIDWIWVA